MFIFSRAVIRRAILLGAHHGAQSTRPHLRRAREIAPENTNRRARVSNDEDESAVAHHASTRIQDVERVRACRAEILISMSGSTRKKAAERVCATPISSQLRQASAKLWPMCWRALGLRYGRSDG